MFHDYHGGDRPADPCVPAHGFRVLNGNPKVSPEIRERVLACAREHDYQLNALAKGLTGGPTHLLGVLVTDISNGFFADLAKEIETAAREQGYSILLFNSDYDPDREQEYLDVVRRYRWTACWRCPSGRQAPSGTTTCSGWTCRW